MADNLGSGWLPGVTRLEYMKILDIKKRCRGVSRGLITETTYYGEQVVLGKFSPGRTW